MVPLGLLFLMAAAGASFPAGDSAVFIRASLESGLRSRLPGAVSSWRGALHRDAASGRMRRHVESRFGARPDSAWLHHMRDSLGRRVTPNWIGTLHADATMEPYFPDQWSLENTGQQYDDVIGVKGADIGVKDAWSLTTGDSSIIVAFLDGGVDVTHPELKGQFAHNKAELAGVAGKDDDGNGYVDDTLGWDFVRDDGVARDLGGHGTATASLLASRWDGNGMAGIAPGVRILPIRVADGGSRVELGALIDGIDYAISRKAKIINLSLGGLSAPDEIDSAIGRAVKAGAIVVASSGNEGVDLGVSRSYPAALRMKGLLVVGASDSRDRQSWYSNYSKELVDLSAPGDALVAASLPDADTIWREGFESGIPGWTTGGTSAIAWGTEACQGTTWLSDSPGKLYASSGRSWIRSPRLNQNRRSGLMLSFALRGCVGISDNVLVESSADSTFATGIDTLYRNGYFREDSAVLMTYDVGQDGKPFYLRFSMISAKPSSSATDSGIMIDDLVLRARDRAQPVVGTYARVWGTSFAAPLVSSALALLVSRYPDTRPESLAVAIVEGGEVLPSLGTASRSGARLYVPGAFKRISSSAIATQVRPVVAAAVVRRKGSFVVREEGDWTLELRDLRGSLVGRESGKGTREIACRSSSPMVWTFRASGRILSGLSLEP